MYKLSIWNAVILMTLAAVIGVGAVNWKIPDWFRLVMLIVSVWLVIVAAAVLLVIIRYHFVNQFRMYQDARTRTAEVVLAEKLRLVSPAAQMEILKHFDFNDLIVVRPGLGVYWEFGTHRVPQEFIYKWAEDALAYAQENPGKLPPVRNYRSVQAEYEWARSIIWFVHNRTEMIRYWGGNQPATIEPGYSLGQVFEFLQIEI